MLKSNSASRVSKFLECERRAYYEIVEGRREPQSIPQTLGEDIHSGVELWLGEGRLPTATELVKQKFGKPPVKKDLSYVIPYVEALKPILPPPKAEELVTELEISIKLPQGIPWRGFIDFALSSGPALEISDLKTSGNLKYAVKTPAQLAADPQMLSYAKAGYDLGHKGEVDLRHVYVQTYLPKGADLKKHLDEGRTLSEISALYLPKKKLPVVVGPVSTIVSEAHVEKEWDKILKITDRMMEVALAPTAMDVQPTGAAKRVCTKYRNNPCPFLSDCGFTTAAPTQIFQGLYPPKENLLLMSSFKDRMKKLKESAPAAEEEEFEQPAPKRTAARGILSDDAPSREYVEAAAEEEPAPITEYPAAKKRGRPKKVATEAIQAKARAVATEEAEEEAAEIGVPKFELWIGCSPVRETENYPALFEDWFAGVVEDLNGRLRRERKINSYWMLPFAEQKEAIAEAVAAHLPTIPPALVMGSLSGPAADVAQLLIPYATQIHRSFR